MGARAAAATRAQPATPAHPFHDIVEARLLTWDGPRLEIAGFYKEDDVEHVTWVDHDEAGRPVRFATVVMHHNRRGTSTQLASCEWERLTVEP